MDVTTLVAGPAQAGPSSPVSKPGIGHAAGAAASPTADASGAGEGFASLVALALGELEGATVAGSDAGAARKGSVPSDDEDVDGDAGDAAASPLDASVDPSTLALLIALATPVAAPPVVVQPDAAGQASADLAAVDGASTGTSVTASAGAVSGATPPESRGPATTTPFDGVLAAATASSEPTGVVTPAAPQVGAPADAATPGIADLPATPVGAVADIAPTAAAPGAAGAVVHGSATPQSDAPAAMPRPDGAAQPAPPHAAARAAQHPLREALAAVAAATGDASGASAPVAEAHAAATPAAQDSTLASTQAAPAVREGQSAAAAPRTAAAPRGDAAVISAVANPGATPDFGSAGDASTGTSPDGSAASAFRGAEGRLDAAVTAAAPTAAAAFSPEALVSGALTSMPGLGLGANADAALRAIELPSAARFGQTLSSLDPDVQNLQAMVRTVRLFSSAAGATEARLHLAPEHLGPVALTVRVEQGSVSAHFRAETPAAHRWIETHQQELRSGLREQGLEVKEIVVTTDPDARRERRQDAPPARPRPRRTQGGDAPRFEVLV